MANKKSKPRVNLQALQQRQQIKSKYGNLIETILIDPRLIGHNRLLEAGENWMKTKEAESQKLSKKIKELTKEFNKIIGEAGAKSTEIVTEANLKIFKAIDEIFPEWKHNEKIYDHGNKVVKIYSKLLKKDN